MPPRSRGNLTEAAVTVAASAIEQRFGPAGLLGVVTPAQVMVAAQRRSSVGAWVATDVIGGAVQHQLPLTRSQVIGDPRQGRLPGTGFGWGHRL